MSYCRFENTAGDLRECLDYIVDDLDSQGESGARISLVETCIDILGALGCKVSDQDENEVVGSDSKRIIIEALEFRQKYEEEYEGPKTAEEVDNSLDGRGPDKGDENL